MLLAGKRPSVTVRPGGDFGFEPQRASTGLPLLRRQKPFLAAVLITVCLVYVLISQIRGHTCGPLILGTDTHCSSSQSAGSDDFNLFYHLGGNGPWIQKRDGINYVDAVLPKTCAVDQVHMLARHAERFPTKSAGERHLYLLSRLQRPDVHVRGPLSFLKSWTYFTNPGKPAFENLTTEGPYAGTKQAHKTGRTLRSRYGHLVSRTRPTRFWSCSSPRDVETARHFAHGFFGPRWETDGSAHLQIIPEAPRQGADTLTPGDTCFRYRTDDTEGHDLGYHKLSYWQPLFAQPIIERLTPLSGGVLLTPVDIYSMMEMCGFEILARGYSPWCAVFTQDEWLQFEYARDLLHFYRAGPGNQYAGAMGWLWLNATQELMSNHSSHDVYFSFVHDGDIAPLMATLQILDEHALIQELPTDRMKEDRRWRTSDVVPMGGRVVFERITCEHDPGETRRYVRLFINDALMKPPGIPAAREIEHGLRLRDFQEFVESRRDVFGDFQDVCMIPLTAPSRITFLHQ